MREVRRNALVSYTPAQMYALVNDAARYPEFVPGCRATRVLAETPVTKTATLELARLGVSIAITTDNRMVPGERIELSLRDGPLKHFTGRWDFLPIRAAGTADAPGAVRGCRVELSVAFEFQNAALGLVLGPLFESTWDTLVDAFVRRAREVYGG
jgi:ribosome-associated toxin RatA of RatAB toxin-antitoxin module